MPIYAYKCASCGYAKDVLQKISDPPLTRCPQCGQERLVKQVTAAGFQLKGSGWYATDFRGGAAAPADSQAQSKPAAKDGQAKPDSKPETKDSPAKPAAKPAAGNAASSASAACGGAGQ